MKKTILTLLLTAALLLGTVPVAFAADTAPNGIWTDYAADQYDGGDGSKSAPYQIATPQQLALLAKTVNNGTTNQSHVNKYYKLTHDLDLSAHRWEPIGRGSSDQSFHNFNAYFDGDGHSITGLYADESEKEWSAGLFGHFGGKELKNLTVDGYVKTRSDDNSADAAGILIGCAHLAYGGSITITNCHAKGKIESNCRAGGLVGNASYATFADCTADVEVNGGPRAGGFIGEDFNGTHKNCVAKGKVSGSWCLGGYAGVLFYKSKVDKCAAYGNVSASNWNVGGFAGYVEDSCQIKNSVSYGDTHTSLDYTELRTGGFVGYNMDSTITACHAAGKVTADHNADRLAGFAGGNSSGTFSGCSYDKTKNEKLEPAITDSDMPETQIAGVPTATVLSNICNDYYGSHDPDNSAFVVDQAATCTEPGEKSHHCTRCGNRTDITAIDATGHHGGYPTCVSPAICDDCGQPYGDIDPIAHNELVYVEAKAPTTEAPGNIAYYTCPDCGKCYTNNDGTEEIAKADTILQQLPKPDPDPDPTPEPDPEPTPVTPTTTKKNTTEETTKKPTTTRSDKTKSPATGRTDAAALALLMGTAAAWLAAAAYRKKQRSDAD